MVYRVWQIVLTATMSCAIGVNYTIFTWLDFEVLGISKGKMSAGLIGWGYLLLLLGLVLFLTLAARKIMNIKMIDTQLDIIMAIIFVLQLPMISLWFMAIFMQGKEAIPGVLLHHVLLGLALYIFLSNQSRSGGILSRVREAEEGM